MTTVRMHAQEFKQTFFHDCFSEPRKQRYQSRTAWIELPQLRGISMTWAGSMKREFTERIQFTRNIGKIARMHSQCVQALSKEPGYEANEILDYMAQLYIEDFKRFSW